MAVTQVEWITCPHCGSIFRVMVPTQTRRLAVCGVRDNSSPYYYYARIPGPRLVREDPGSGYTFEGTSLSDRQASFVGTVCPKSTCGQSLWVFCVYA